MLRIALSALALFFIAGEATAQAETPAALIAEFDGEWSSDGDAFGASATSTMHWASSLDGKFMQLSYRIEMSRAADASSVFEGVAYYRLDKSDAISGFWADNSGDLHPLHAKRDGQAIVSHWGAAGGKQGRTRYELTGADEMRVIDWILTPDGWRQFNDNIFSRTKPG